jgi:hypothetical protein
MLLSVHVGYRDDMPAAARDALYYTIALHGHSATVTMKYKRSTYDSNSHTHHPEQKTPRIVRLYVVYIIHSI